MRQENHHVREIAELSAILQKIRDKIIAELIQGYSV